MDEQGDRQRQPKQEDKQILKSGMGKDKDTEKAKENSPNLRRKEEVSLYEVKEFQDSEPKVVISSQQKTIKEQFPIFPRRIFPYRVHWCWEPTFNCNYRCSYCVQWNEEKIPQVGLKQWEKIWDNLFDKYWSGQIRFTGGEPTIYPNFLELLSILLNKHTVDITTNLSFQIKRFTQLVKPGGIAISASFHPEYVRFTEFLDKVVYLHSHGYPTTISYVAYPPNLEKMMEYKRMAEDRQIIFKVIPFYGKFQNREFPRDYNEEERCFLKKAVEESTSPLQEEINKRFYDKHITKEADISHISKEMSSKGARLCRMGQMYAIIKSQGDVYRCCATPKAEKIGNIFDENFRLLDEPKQCYIKDCPCYKAMIVGFQEDRWLPLWDFLPHPIYNTEYIKKAILTDSIAREDNERIRA